MKHEKILKRSDGTRVNITISLWLVGWENKLSYDVSVSICEPRKRTFHYVNDTDNYTWRKLNSEEKKIYELEQNLKYVTIEEIQETAIELWNKLKPTFLNTDFKNSTT